MIITLFVIAFVLMALLLWWLLRAPRSERGMEALISAFSSRRLIESRLGGGFAAAKFDPSRDNREGIDEDALARARQLIEDSAVYEDGFQSAMVQARLLAIDGHPADAEKLLRKALSKNEPSAAFHNDLGVCLLEAGKLESALEEFERALERDSAMSEALFNRALCYERLALRDAAREEYSRIAEKERDPGWQNDIRSRIEKLSRLPDPQKSEGNVISAFSDALTEGRTDRAKQITSENFDTFYRYALIDLTIDHLGAAVAGEKDASESSLRRMELIGEFFIETKGDRFVSDAAAFLRNLNQEDQSEELKLIREYRDAIKATDPRNGAQRETAFERLRKVAESFRARGNDQRALKAELRVANYRYESGRLTDSIAILEKNVALAERSQWLNEYAALLNALSIDYTRLGRDVTSIRLCEKAGKIHRRMHETAYEAKALQLISVAYRRLGDLDSALQKLRESLHSALLSSPSLQDLSFTYFSISNIYRQKGNHQIALLFAKQALVLAEAANDTDRIAQILMAIALEYAAINQFDQAALYTDKSLRLISGAESGQHDYTRSLVLIQAGQVAFQTGNAAQAKEYYDKAEALALKIEDNKLLLMESLRGRASALAAEGQLRQARADVARLVEYIERYRGGISESKFRSSFLAASHRAFDEIISLSATVFGLPQEAFDMSERARARAMLDEIRSRQQAGKPGNDSILKTASSLDLKQIRAFLPDSLTVVEYAVTEKQTFIFIVRRSGLEVAVSPAGIELIDRLVSQYISDLKSVAPVDQMEQKARELYRYLIEPIEGYINRADVICIVPDKALHFIPFAALVDKEGRYFIDSFRLSYAPSASALAYCLDEYGKKPASKSERIVSVGNPEFDSEKFPNLPPLPDSEREAEESARFYTDSTVLRRSDATESRVRAAIGDCDVAHFALHCRVEENSPWLAELILAKPKPGAEGVGLPAARNDGVLSLDEIYAIELPRTRLAVLSACETGLGHYYRGEGMVSLARPFIAAGVPQVIASLWPVASRETSQLMIEFHRERKNGKGKTVDALREAQLRMARSGLPPFYWASFIAIGSAN
ncbi:MAG: CHAT domain-containing protein [Acidobacteriota bacterium]